MLVNIR